jgi:hypothetical protein
VRTWLKEGLVDFVVPLLYGYMVIDPDMPIDWLIEAAHTSDVSVYAMLMPYWRDEKDMRYRDRIYATPAMMRAAAANFWSRGVDGLYTWFLRWPLRTVERGILTELGDPDLVKEGNKHYVLRRRDKVAAELGYNAILPLEIPSADPSKRYKIPFYLADDFQGASDRIRDVQLRIDVENLVKADKLTILLNGQSLANETCKSTSYQYMGQWLEFHLKGVRPRKGDNLLEIALEKRPEGLHAGVTINDVEVLVEYEHPDELTYRPPLM